MELSCPKLRKLLYLFKKNFFFYFTMELAKPEKQKFFILQEMKLSYIFSKKFYI